MNFGVNEIKGIYVGSTAAAQMYLGTSKVWPKEEPQPVTNDWLCFTAQQADSTVRLDKSSSSLSSVSLETSYDGSSWTDYSWTEITGDTLTLANVGDKVYMRAKNENLSLNPSPSPSYNFKMTGTIAASGNIQTLLKADGSRTDAPIYCFYRVFYNCTSLTTPPALPATTLIDYCYTSMFQNCSSLTTPPALPATTLASNCYNSMFDGCSSLTSAPALPATTLAERCYQNMFRACTSLTTAPALPATISGANPHVYSGMFRNCSSLSSINVSFTRWNVNATQSWVQGVASTGTFTCPTALGTNETITRGISNCPSGWTVVNTDA